MLKESSINERLDSYDETKMMNHMEDEQDNFNRMFMC